jgi:hypothetical protein
MACIIAGKFIGENAIVTQVYRIATNGPFQETPVACISQSGRGIAKEWWWLAPVWSEVDSHSYRPSEDQVRRQQAE